MESGKQKSWTPFKPMFKRIGLGNRVGDGLKAWPVENKPIEPIKSIIKDPIINTIGAISIVILWVVIIAVLCYFLPWYYVISGILLLVLAFTVIVFHAISSLPF